jgi:hypothetical protein
MFSEEASTMSAFAATGATADDMSKVAETEAHAIEVVAEHGAGPHALADVAHAEAETIQTAALTGADPAEIVHSVEEESRLFEGAESTEEIGHLVEAADLAHEIAIHAVVEAAVHGEPITGHNDDGDDYDDGDDDDHSSVTSAEKELKADSQALMNMPDAAKISIAVGGVLVCTALAAMLIVRVRRRSHAAGENCHGNGLRHWSAAHAQAGSGPVLQTAGLVPGPASVL